MYFTIVFSVLLAAANVATLPLAPIAAKHLPTHTHIPAVSPSAPALDAEKHFPFPTPTSTLPATERKAAAVIGLGGGMSTASATASTASAIGVPFPIPIGLPIGPLPSPTATSPTVWDFGTGPLSGRSMPWLEELERALEEAKEGEGKEGGGGVVGALVGVEEEMKIKGE